MTVEPPGYVLFDEETGKYWCPFCDGRLLRIGDYSECTECEARFQRQSGGEQGSLSKFDTLCEGGDDA